MGGLNTMLSRTFLSRATRCMGLSTAHRSLATRTPIVGGNWKCNPTSPSALDELIQNINACETSKCEVYVCPSPLHVALVNGKLTNGAKIAPQNCNFTGPGAYTGEMAVDQMAAMGIEWCLIGHSERRGEFGLPTPAESNQLLATKLAYILENGLKCVFCIGEPLPTREQGLDAVLAHCAGQLEQIKELLDPDKVVIAYEPVWAIGTGVVATPEQAQEVHAHLRQWLVGEVNQEVSDSLRILYGGSVNAKNCRELAKCGDIDGFLVGGASLKPEFSEIINANN